MKKLALAIVVLLLGLSVPGRAQQVTSEFLFEQAPKRFAFVVGNSTYRTATALPGSVKDAEAVDSLLKATLKFDVVKTWKNVGTADEFGSNLKTELKKVPKGSIVVFFFSGHGFFHGRESYLVPVDVGNNVGEADLRKQFVLVSQIKAAIKETDPTFFLMILDACRSSTSYARHPDLANKVRTLGGANEIQLGDNGIVWSAADTGRAAKARDNALSYFTEAVQGFLGNKDREIKALAQKVADSVFANTDHSQLPVYSSTLTGDVYLNPSSKRQQDVRFAWETALKRSTAGEVQRFLSQYRATSYEAAARLWLSKNTNRRWAYRTQFSPLMMERLWETAPSDGRPVKALAISGGFQFIKNVTVRGGVIGSFDESMDVADLLTRSQLAMVALQDISVKDGPNFEADEKRKLGSNDIAYIIGAERNASGTWLRIHDRGSDNLYFRLPDSVKVEKKEMGVKAKEIFVGASADSSAYLADPLAIQELIPFCRRMTWVSIAVPKGTSAEEEQQRDLIASNASDALERACRAAGRPSLLRGITAIVRSVDFPGSKVRIRVFARLKA